MKALAPVLALLAALLAAPVDAHAHGRSVSYSRWTPTATGAAVELRVAAIDLTMLQLDAWTDGEAIGRWATERLVASRGDRPCTAPAPRTAAPRDGEVVVAWDVACGGPPDVIATRLFADVAPSHLHFARLALADGGVTERVLGADEPRWVLASAAAAPAGSSFADYVALGVEHIRTGWDHLAFVLALLLLAESLREVATIVTSFTVAHSLTLAAAVLGIVRPEPAAVEALIGYSIALVAIENGWLLGGRDRATPWIVGGATALAAVVAPGHVARVTLAGLAVFAVCHVLLLARSPRPARLRAIVAFGFGLVHGFGFAGVLASLDLPRERLAAALVGFNVGVEIGQLAVVVVGWTILAALDRRFAGARRRVAEVGSAAIAGLGLVLFLTRGWG